MRTIALIRAGVVINKIMAESINAVPELDCDALLDVTGLNANIGDHVPAGGFPVINTPAPAQRPALVITNIQSNGEPGLLHAPAGFLEATCPVGTTLTFTAELRFGDNVLPISDSFRMPIRQRAGREGMLLASMVNGIVTVVAPFTAPGDDGAWLVDAATINASLPADKQMDFAGITVNVYRVAA